MLLSDVLHGDTKKLRKCCKSLLIQRNIIIYYINVLCLYFIEKCAGHKCCLCLYGSGSRNALNEHHLAVHTTPIKTDEQQIGYLFT